jgi:hypothetical protein
MKSILKGKMYILLSTNGLILGVSPSDIILKFKYNIKILNRNSLG